MQERFQELVGEAILSLPQDLKTMLRVLEDPNIDDDSRVKCAGAIIHVLSGTNAIPGVRGVLAYVDDVLVLRLVLEDIRTRSADPLARYAEDAPALLGQLEEFLREARAFLGELMPRVEKSVRQCVELTHQGYSAKQCADEDDAGTWLYDEVHSAIVEQLEFDDEEVAREAKRVDVLLQPLNSRVMRG